MSNPTIADTFSALKRFSNESIAVQQIQESKFSQKKSCPRCGCEELGFLSTRNLSRCRKCRYAFSVKVGTLMQDSPLPVGKWASGIWLLANSRGITCARITELLAVTQKTAWWMCQKINKASDLIQNQGGAAPARYIPWAREVEQISESYPFSPSQDVASDAIIKAVHDMVSRDCPSPMRADVSQELLLRIFSGEATILTARAMIPEIRKDNWLYAEKFHSHVSLNAPVYEDGTELGETLMTNIQKNFLDPWEEEDRDISFEEREASREDNFGRVTARY